MLTLGIDDDQLQEAEEKKREVHEEILEKQRGKNDAKITSDKIANAKAFEKLGVDLSKEKVCLSYSYARGLVVFFFNNCYTAD